MDVVSGWLTGVRIQRSQEILILVSTLPSTMPLADVTRTLWQQCGGPLGEIPQLIELLAYLKFVRLENDSVVRTAVGDKVSKALKSGRRALFDLTLIRTRYFH